MKKINFKNLGNAEILSKDELKKISGGDGSTQVCDCGPDCHVIASSKNNCEDVCADFDCDS